MRCFIALEFPDDIKEKIYRSIKPEVRSKPELKWVSQENLHLTLKFLGEISEHKAREVAEELEKNFRGAKKIRVKLGKVGSFTDRGYIRVLWIGVEEGENEIKGLAEIVEKSMKKLGFPREKREFVPHLTIARTRKRSSKRYRPSDFNIDLKIPKFFIREIVLYRSTLTPDGPIYQKLNVIRLDG